MDKYNVFEKSGGVLDPQEELYSAEDKKVNTKAISKMPTFDPNDDWVKQYQKDFGQDPSFF